MNARSPVAGWLYILAAFALGLLVATVLWAAPPRPQPLKSNIRLLGEVTTVMTSDDPLVQELERDDARRERQKAAEEKGAWK